MRSGAELKSRGIPVSEPERIRLSLVFGLLKKTMPVGGAYIPPQFRNEFRNLFWRDGQSGNNGKMKAYMVPNAADRGIEGIKEAIVKRKFIRRSLGVYTKAISRCQTRRNAAELRHGDDIFIF